MRRLGMEVETNAVALTVEHDVKQGPYASCDTVADVLREFEIEHEDAPENLSRVADAMEESGCDHSVDEIEQIRLVQHLNGLVGPTDPCLT
jgi:hypothetical protein